MVYRVGEVAISVRLDTARYVFSYKISDAMLTAIRWADSLTESRARCAYRAVVSTLR